MSITIKGEPDELAGFVTGNSIEFKVQGTKVDFVEEKKKKEV